MDKTEVMTDTNEQLFLSIYMSYMPMLRVVAKRQGLPYDEIDDVVQETFLAYYRHYPLTWEDYMVKAMLCRILKNRCIDYKRKADTHPTTYMDPESMRVAITAQSKLKVKDALALYLEKEEYRAFWEALKSMREDWSQVFILHFIQDRPMAEVSEILGISDAACRTRLNRGRKYLREIIGRDKA